VRSGPVQALDLVNATYKMTKLKLNTCSETIFIKPVSEDEAEKVIRNLKGKLSIGIYEVPDLVVKKCMKSIKKPLTNIHNASLESGIFPDRLKLAVVKPLHKNGDTENIQNYKPISLLSVFAKIYKS
jgi:hypothetical protein